MSRRGRRGVIAASRRRSSGGGSPAFRTSARGNDEATGNNSTSVITIPGTVALGDVMVVAFQGFGRPLRNPLKLEKTAEELVAVTPEASIWTAEEQQRWLDTVDADIAAGGFIAGVTQLFVWARRPAVE